MQKLRPVTKPNKQRKMLYDAPDHIRRKLLSAHLSSDLRGTHIVKSLPVRSGDTIRVVRGDHKGFEGKITEIDLRKYRVYVEGLTREKVDGTSVFVPVHPSKVVLTRLNLDDKWRRKILERKQKAQKKPEKLEKKPELETVQQPEKLEKKPELETVQKPSEVAELKAPAEEKPVAAEEPKEKKAEKKEKKPRRPAAAKKEARIVKAEKEKKPKAEKKAARSKPARKAEQGEE